MFRLIKVGTIKFKLIALVTGCFCWPWQTDTSMEKPDRLVEFPHHEGIESQLCDIASERTGVRVIIPCPNPQQPSPLAFLGEKDKARRTFTNHASGIVKKSLVSTGSHGAAQLEPVSTSPNKVQSVGILVTCFFSQRTKTYNYEMHNIVFSLFTKSKVKC